MLTGFAWRGFAGLGERVFIYTEGARLHYLYDKCNAVLDKTGLLGLS